MCVQMQVEDKLAMDAAWTLLDLDAVQSDGVSEQKSRCTHPCKHTHSHAFAHETEVSGGVSV